MNLIKAWKAYRKSVSAGKTARSYLKRAKEIASDIDKADEWNACMTLASLCLVEQLKYQREYKEASR